MLCVKGCGFYGSQENDGHCSTCYVEKKQNICIEKEQSISDKPKLKRKCDKCKRKVGINGFLCRCNQTFCSKHRYSFEHDCTFDTVQYEKKRIEKANPKIEKQKLEKI